MDEPAIIHWQVGDPLELWEMHDRAPSVRAYAGNSRFTSTSGNHVQPLTDDAQYCFVKIVNRRTGDVLERRFELTHKGM